VKYEEVYLKGYQTMAEAQAGLKRYFNLYNNERFHQSLGYRTPKEVYACTGMPLSSRPLAYHWSS